MFSSRRMRRGIIISFISCAHHPICLSSRLWSWVSLMHVHTHTQSCTVHHFFNCTISNYKTSSLKSAHFLSPEEQLITFVFFRVVEWAAAPWHIKILCYLEHLMKTLATTIQNRQWTHIKRAAVALHSIIIVQHSKSIISVTQPNKNKKINVFSSDLSRTIFNGNI